MTQKLKLSALIHGVCVACIKKQTSQQELQNVSLAHTAFDSISHCLTQLKVRTLTSGANDSILQYTNGVYTKYCSV